MKFRLSGSLLFLILLSTAPAYAHVNGEAGWLHPLSGLDHLLAMIAVGAWSSQIGGRAIWIVPSAFVCFMLLGGLAGFENIELPGTEIAVSLSVVLLGTAIALKQKLPVAIAATATALFGVFHGYAHGYEMPLMSNKVAYTLGFLGTTAMLHVIGAVGAYYLLKNPAGDKLLRLLGTVSVICGFYLVSQVI
ncbi:HupE/UreJ family protein [Buttiauxella sp. B2]|uniref:HupE/UreJ family protein n=1 Tax=Buttiauxella sp. B2 TaxID=2587812 RepID=UPI00111D8D94|nr:HupE/UreJ family protein [Buttiauxella sp. B2]TNV10187.1 HupE/UreJ family protein [Buttiauxella sp. B2]